MVDILKREKEFQKLNEELDKKAKSIIEKSSNNITPTTTVKSNSNPSNNVKDNKKEHFDELKQNHYQKANTIPKRFRDSLTNRKIKENKPLELCEKSIQISENQFAIDETDEKNTEDAIEPLPENILNNEVEADPIVNEEPITSKYFAFKEEMKKKLLPKANTVPKRLRDTLTNRKTKEKKIAELTETSFNISEIQTNESEDVVVEVNEESIQLDNEIESEDLKNVVSITSSTTSTFAKIKNGTNSLSSIKSNDSDISSIRSSKKSTMKNDSLPTKKVLTTEGLVKYLKSKVSILEVELSNTRNEVAKQIKELEFCFETQQKFETQRDQAISKNNALTEQIEKTNEKVNDIEKKLKDREVEVNNTKRELENLKREIKVLNQTNKNLEKRLYRSNEELENSKTSVDSIKKNERNQMEVARVEKEKLEKQIKDLKRQRNEFLNAYKKQLFLIDNLKRQNVCLEQCHIIGFGEKQFSKVLDLNKE